MSTRWYPIYQKGNPQLRVFLPNFWMKLVKPESKMPSNIVTFHCSMEMTKYDVSNYLSKIYDVHPVSVRTRIQLGKFVVERGRVAKKLDDTKVAYVVLEDDSFEFPNILQAMELEREQKKDKLEKEIPGEAMKIPKNLAPGEVAWFNTYCNVPTAVTKK